MSFRQFIAAFMIFVSLSAQARTELACGMNPAATAMSDCCEPEVKAPCDAGVSAMHCCDPVAPNDAPLSHGSNAMESALHGLLQDGVVHPVLVSTFQPRLPTAVDVDHRYPVHTEADEGRRRVRPLYLQTARLRL